MLCTPTRSQCRGLHAPRLAVVRAEKHVDDLEYVDGRLQLFPEAREIAACVAPRLVLVAGGRPMSELHLTPKELAARLRKTVGTLANWRTAGIGPKFIKCRAVLYPISEVGKWEREMLASSTA
jgi:hypothetical protein